MQRWDYKFIEVYFEPGLGGGWKWKENGQAVAGKPDMLARSRTLGFEGRELVSIAPHDPNRIEYWFKRPLTENVPPPLPKT